MRYFFDGETLFTEEEVDNYEISSSNWKTLEFSSFLQLPYFKIW